MAFVLVAEDDPDHQRLVADTVRALGHEVTLADDGWAALVAATRRRPDLVVADVDMPEMDGLQLCRALSEDPVLTDVPVVLVTAMLLPDDPQLTASGAVAVVHKPFEVRRLSATIAAYTAAHQGTAGRPRILPPVAPAFLEAMVESVDVGMAACDTTGRLTVFNDFLRDFFGDDSAAVPVKEWAQQFDLRHSDGSRLHTSELPLIRALHGESVEHAGQQVLDRHGRRRWLTINARPVRDDGTVIGAVAAVHDVTTEYRSRLYQACKNEVLKVLAESPTAEAAGDGIVRGLASALDWPYVRLWLLDPVITRMRPVASYTAAGESDLPMPTSLSRGQGLAGACWQDDEMLWVPDIHAADSPVLPEVAEAASYRAAGAIPIRSGGRVTGVLTYFSHQLHDPEPALVLLLIGVAGSVGAYLERRRADELAHNLAATTDEYVALVGHELRTPLTSITAYAELIAESPDLPADVRELIDVVGRNSRSLHQLVECLLDLAALEAGHRPLAADEVDVTALAAAGGQAAAAASGRDVTVDAPPAGPLTVVGDRYRLTQMLHGLLDNALKFSDPDTPVTVRVTADDDTVTLAVSDTGIGLPSDAQPQLFRRLYRGDNARHSGIPGNGLGLALSRAIVERHRGTITLAAHQPAGTTVTVRLPRSA